MAARVARDIPEGSYVNLGIGLPTLVANHLPRDREIFLHSENGLLGMGPAPAAGEEDPDLINAGKQPVTLAHRRRVFPSRRLVRDDARRASRFLRPRRVPGLRPGTSPTGTPARRTRFPRSAGAMDLAIGAKKTYVMMEHATKSGELKIVARCSYPLTGIGCVARIYTDLAVIDVGRQPGLLVARLSKASGFDELQANDRRAARSRLKHQ